LQVNQFHAADGHIVLSCGRRDKLAHVVRSIAKDDRPGDMQITVAARERQIELLASQAIRIAGCIQLGIESAHLRRAVRLQIIHAIDGSIFQEQSKRIGEMQRRFVQLICNFDVG
jgi:hypothetical protein